MRIKSEAELLDPAVRAKVIEEINSPENLARKRAAYKRHIVYKDQISLFVKENLLKQFDEKTVNEMSYALSNISVMRKVIDKLARVYAYGCQRVVKNDDGKTDIENSSKLQALAKELDANTQMKTNNRFLKRDRNTALFIKPCPVYQPDGSEKYAIKLQPLAPYLYDAIEDFYDRTKPIAFILSNFKYGGTEYSRVDASREGRGVESIPNSNLPKGNQSDEIIADEKEDEGSNKDTYVFWTKSYHFTCLADGTIVSPDGQPINISTPDGLSQILNPIQKQTIIDFAIDRDNSFWAQGGDDLVDGAILINSMLTHIMHVGVTQGYGQFYMKGKNLPRNIVLGPSKAILMEYEENEPVPDIGFAQSQPALGDLMRLVEMYTALLLTTNNLSTSGVSTQLSGSSGFASGIALMIDKSESMEDVSDQRQIFIDKEPIVWDRVNAWLNVYGSNGQLVDELDGLTLPEDFSMELIFPHGQIIMSEQDKLDILERRKKLGINTMIDLIKIDNPELTDEQAEQKLKDLIADKMKRYLSSLGTSEEPTQAATTEPTEVEIETEDSEEENGESENEGDESNGQQLEDSERD